MDTYESQRLVVKCEFLDQLISKYRDEGWTYEGCVTFCGNLPEGNVIAQFHRGYFDTHR